MPRSHRTYLTLRPDQEEALGDVCAESGTPQAEVIRRAIDQFLKLTPPVRVRQAQPCGTHPADEEVER